MFSCFYEGSFLNPINISASSESMTRVVLACRIERGWMRRRAWQRMTNPTQRIDHWLLVGTKRTTTQIRRYLQIPSLKPRDRQQSQRKIKIQRNILPGDTSPDAEEVSPGASETNYRYNVPRLLRISATKRRKI